MTDGRPRCPNRGPHAGLPAAARRRVGLAAAARAWLRLAAGARRLRAAAIGLAILVAAQTAQAQRIEFHGRGELRLDERIESILDGQSHIFILRDTLLAVSDTLPGSVMVVGPTVRVEGVIRGDLVIVDANVFLRPTARVLGDVVNIAGGYYPSAQASVAGEVEDYPNAPYDVEYGENVRRIVGTLRRTLLQPDGLRGLRPPSYDRVDGLTPGIGATYLLPWLGPVEPFVHGFAEYHSRPGDFGGGGELGFVRGDFTVAFGAERVTRTNEDWIRGVLHNSAAYLFLGKDYRNYYRADRFFARAEWTHEDAIRTWVLRVRAEREDARSLNAGQPWTLFDPDSVRPNPDVGRSRIASLTVSSNAEWRRPTFLAEVEAEIELGAEVLSGDHGFGRVEIAADWAMAALANHTLELEVHLQAPLPGTDALPPQRWTFVGGSGTLWTYQIAAFPGDRVVFVETVYSIPFPPSFRLPLLGPLSFDLLHRVGMAWSEGVSRDLEQNIGLRLGTPIAWARIVTHPRDFSGALEFGVGLRMPRSHPWTSRAPE